MLALLYKETPQPGRKIVPCEARGGGVAADRSLLHQEP